MKNSTICKMYVPNEIPLSQPAASRPGDRLGECGGGVVAWRKPALAQPMILFVVSQRMVSKSIIWYHLVSLGLCWVGPGKHCPMLKLLVESECSFVQPQPPGAKVYRRQPVNFGKVLGRNPAEDLAAPKTAPFLHRFCTRNGHVCSARFTAWKNFTVAKLNHGGVLLNPVSGSRALRRSW